MVIAAGIGAAAAIGGAAISATGASSAAGKQAGAANNASAQQNAWNQLNYNNAAPYRGFGQAAIDTLQPQLGSYSSYVSPYYAMAGQSIQDTPQWMPAFQALPNAPQQMTQAQLETTPGYQFNLGQGLKATQSAAAARGLGVSGAALKGAASYATGLADSTYQNQFANQQQLYQDAYNSINQGNQNKQATWQDQLAQVNSRFNNLFNMGQSDQANKNTQYSNLLGAVSLGSNSVSQTGNMTTQGAANAGNFLTQAGNAQAAGQVGTANAINSGLTGAANNYMQYAMLNKLMGSGGGGAPSTMPALASGGSAFDMGGIY